MVRALLAMTCCVLGQPQERPSVPSGAELAKSHRLEVLPAAVDGVPIRVVAADDGSPVADALVVRVVEAQFSSSFNHGLRRGLDSFDVLRRAGRSRLTASDGTTFVEPTDGWEIAVFAFRGADFGRTTVELHDRSEHVIELGSRGLPVTVRGADGTPRAGIPLALATCAFTSFDLGAWQGTTDVAGRVVIPALDLERHCHRTCGRQAGVVFSFPAFGSAFRPLDAADHEPVELVLPECGEVVVDLVDADRKPWSAERLRKSDALLIVVPKSARRAGLDRHGADGWPSNVEVPCSDSRIRLPRVEVGLRLELWVESESGRFASADRIELAGPTMAGEIVRAAIEVMGDEAEEASAAEADESSDSPSLMDESDSNRASESSIPLRVLADVPIRPLELRARLRRMVAGSAETSDTVADPDLSSESWIDARGATTIRRVPEGEWAVALTLAHGYSTLIAPSLLAEFDHVTVPPRAFVVDPRLLAIDLRGKLRRLCFEVVDADGRALSGSVRFRNPATGALEDERGFESGTCDVLTKADDERIAVLSADRFRPAEIDSAASRERVVLRPGIPIRLVLDPKSKLPTAPNTRLYVGVSERPRCGAPPDPDAEDFDVRTVAIKPGGSASFAIPEAGDRRVVLLVTHDADEEGATYEELATVAPTIQVEDRDDEQLFVVALAE